MSTNRIKTIGTTWNSHCYEPIGLTNQWDFRKNNFPLNPSDAIKAITLYVDIHHERRSDWLTTFYRTHDTDVGMQTRRIRRQITLTHKWLIIGGIKEKFVISCMALMSFVRQLNRWMPKLIFKYLPQLANHMISIHFSIW